MIEAMDAAVVSVCQKYPGASLTRSYHTALKTLLIFPAEDLLIVLYEPINVVGRSIWWIKKDEISLSCFHQRAFEIASF